MLVATVRAVELARFTDEARHGRSRTSQRGIRVPLQRGARQVAGRGAHPDPRSRVVERQRNGSRADERLQLATRGSADAVTAQRDICGIAEYLGLAGPRTACGTGANGWDVGAYPRGAALVAAAVDARRAGLEPPLAGRLLEELAGQYLHRRGGDRLRPEPVDVAWEWVLRARRATTALMTGSAKSGYDVFDYLVDAVQRENTPETFVPESVLRTAVGLRPRPRGDDHRCHSP